MKVDDMLGGAEQKDD